MRKKLKKAVFCLVVVKDNTYKNKVHDQDLIAAAAGDWEWHYSF